MSEKIVGIRELKANISKYLKEVKDGKKLKISYRGKEIAVIVPILRDKKDKEEDVLFRLLQEGKIVFPEIKTIHKKKPKRKKFSGMPFSDSVIEDRR